MILKTNNGLKEVNVLELDFTNIMCDLEDNGIDVMALLDEEQRESIKVFSTIRAILSALIGIKDLKEAGKILTEHLKNGGTIDSIMDEFIEVMNHAGFGEVAEEKALKKEKATPATE